MRNRSLFGMIAALSALTFSMGVSAQALYVTPSGDVGVGTNTPAGSLEVLRTDGTAQIRVDEQSTTSSTQQLFFLRNKGLTKFIIDNTDGAQWAFANKGTSFRVSRQGSGNVELEVFNNGDATLAGVLTENSDINAKQDIVPVDGRNILEKLAKLDISEWSYKDAPADRHVGPMAQDFRSVFGLGHTDKGIASLDSAGVALAAIKALMEKNALLEEQNTSIAAQNSSQSAQIKTLEQRLTLLEIQQAEIQSTVARVLESRKAHNILMPTVLN